MKSLIQTRFTLTRWLLPACLFAGVAGLSAQAKRQSPPAPIERQAPPKQQLIQRPSGQRPPAQQHLSQWMESHRDQPIEQQQRALAAEPGFRQLQPDEQARIHNRLEQLNTMSPLQRQRVLDRTEAMERLSPPQRVQVRGALRDLGALPEDRRKAVAKTFRGLRDLPPGQQQMYLNSSQIRSQFSDQERGTLNNLLNAAPYLPPPANQPPH